MAERWIRLAQWLLGLAVVVFAGRAILRNWDEIAAAQLHWHLGWGHLFLGVIAVWITFVILYEAWRRMLAGWGYHVAWWEGARIWLLSSMAKYVPGKVWALAGMAVMAERRGIPAWAATASALLLQVLSLGGGALVLALFGLAVFEERGIGTAVFVALAAASIAVTSLALRPAIAGRLVERFVPNAGGGPLPPATTVLWGALANTVAWLGYGAAFWLFAMGTLPAAGLGLREAVGASTAAYVGGVLAPFAPGGLGVREGILVLVLRDQTGLAPALALAAVARLGMTLAEVVVSLPFLLRREASHS